VAQRVLGEKGVGEGWSRVNPVVSSDFACTFMLPESFAVMAVQQVGLMKLLDHFGKLAGGSRQIE
jgi:hypothetical protein